MDKVHQQADLIGKKISPFVDSQPIIGGAGAVAGGAGAVAGGAGAGFEDQKIPAGSDTQPPATSPPSPPSPDNGGSQSSPPPATSSPPPVPITPPPTPPSSPPPSITPPPSPPQPQPPPQPNNPPVVNPSPNPNPNPQFPLPSLSPPAVVNQPETPNQNSQPSNPVTPPAPFSPPSPVDSSSQVSPPFSNLLPPMIPLTPYSQGNSLVTPNSPVEGSNDVPSSSSSSPSPPSPSGSNNHSGNSHGHDNVNSRNGGNGGHGNGSNYSEKTMIGIGIAGAVVVVFLVAVFVFRKRNRKGSSRRTNHPFLPSANVSVNTEGFNYYRQNHGNGNNSAQNSSPDNESNVLKPGRSTPEAAAMIGNSKTLFTYDELNQITDGFSKKNMVGEGGFGCVYKGILYEGKAIAIKQLKLINAEGYREFKAEVEIISRVHHRHLVSLVGYCISEHHRFLIYEFVPNDTLDHHLHGKGLPVLEWSRRVKIAIGAAKGLAYLHEDCHPKIIHRDIKSSNILLDDEFEAQVADFGLARLNDTTQSHISTRVMGTFGYLAPEYASSGKLTDRSDVFSFGVVLLELITGRKPVDTSQPLGEESLVEWARPRLIEAIERRDISEVVDQRLENDYIEGEVYRMIETAASCVRHSALKRPRMVQVVRALDTRDDLSDLTNGVKVGQSTIYNSGQYDSEIRNFRRTSDDFSDLSTNNGYQTSQDYTSHESESRALNTNSRNIR